MNIEKMIGQGVKCKGKYRQDYRKMVRLAKVEGLIRKNVNDLRQDRNRAR
jgi:hypothetical protein